MNTIVSNFTVIWEENDKSVLRAMHPIKKIVAINLVPVKVPLKKT